MRWFSSFTNYLKKIAEHIRVNLLSSILADYSPSDLSDMISELKVLIHVGEHENVLRILGACTRGKNDRKIKCHFKYHLYTYIPTFVALSSIATLVLCCSACKTCLYIFERIAYTFNKDLTPVKPVQVLQALAKFVDHFLKFPFL